VGNGARFVFTAFFSRFFVIAGCRFDVETAAVAANKEMKSITRRHGQKYPRSCDEPEIVIAKVTADRFPWLAGQSENVFGSIERG
jgi:hypothetical protein